MLPSTNDPNELNHSTKLNLTTGLQPMTESDQMLANFLTNFKPSRKIREQIRADARGLSVSRPPNIVLGSVDRKPSPAEVPTKTAASGGPIQR